MYVCVYVYIYCSGIQDTVNTEYDGDHFSTFWSDMQRYVAELWKILATGVHSTNLHVIYPNRTHTQCMNTINEHYGC